MDWEAFRKKRAENKAKKRLDTIRKRATSKDKDLVQEERASPLSKLSSHPKATKDDLSEVTDVTPKSTEERTYKEAVPRSTSSAEEREINLGNQAKSECLLLIDKRRKQLGLQEGEATDDKSLERLEARLAAALLRIKNAEAKIAGEKPLAKEASIPNSETSPSAEAPYLEFDISLDKVAVGTKFYFWDPQLGGTYEVKELPSEENGNKFTIYWEEEGKIIKRSKEQFLSVLKSGRATLVEPLFDEMPLVLPDEVRLHKEIGELRKSEAAIKKVLEGYLLGSEDHPEKGLETTYALLEKEREKIRQKLAILLKVYENEEKEYLKQREDNLGNQRALDEINSKLKKVQKYIKIITGGGGRQTFPIENIL